MKILKNLRNELVRLRNLSSEKTGNLRNSPALEKTHRFLYSDTECIGFFNIFVAHKFQIFVWHKMFVTATIYVNKFLSGTKHLDQPKTFLDL
jgi:hypothetical protein